MNQKIRPGSPFLFCLIKTLNLVFAAAAMALFALAIWLWVKLSVFSIIEVVFLTLGVLQLALVALAWTAKTSTAKLKCYMFLMTILFLIQLVAVILVFALGQDIINAVVDKIDGQSQYDELKGYLNLVNYFVIGSLAVELLLVLFVYCYVGSLRNRNNEYDYKMVDSDGNKMTIEQKQMKDKEAIQEKYAKKREELHQKYPGYSRNN